MLLGTLGSPRIRGGILGGAGVGRIESHTTAFEFESLHLLESGLGILVGVEVDVAEATGPLHSLVGDDAGVGETLAFLECLPQQVVIDTPAKVSDEKSVVVFRRLGLGLLERGSYLLIRLALLGVGLLLDLRLLLVLRIRVGVVRAVRIVRISLRGIVRVVIR